MAIAIAALLVLSACTARPVHEADKLNALSYHYHYRNLDPWPCLETIRLARPRL